MNRAAKTMGKLVAVMIAVAAAERAMAQQPAPAVEPERGGIRRIVVNVPAMRLDLLENGELVKSYRIAVGKRSSPTPLGAYRVARLVKDPAWYGPHKQIVEPGGGNPVGTRWIGLDKRGYGIHGTNAPKSIGRAASHGCIRMRNADAEDLFSRVRVGDPVEILYETTTADGQVYTDVYNRDSSAAQATVGGGS